MIVSERAGKKPSWLLCIVVFVLVEVCQSLPAETAYVSDVHFRPSERAVGLGLIPPRVQAMA